MKLRNTKFEWIGQASATTACCVVYGVSYLLLYLLCLWCFAIGAATIAVGSALCWTGEKFKIVGNNSANSGAECGEKL